MPTPRDARLIAAAELRQWELETEQAPSDALRFWKMAAHGGVQAVTVPEALFPAGERRQQQGDGEDQQQQQAVGVKNENAKQQVSAPLGGNRKARGVKLPVEASKGKEPQQQKQHHQQKQKREPKQANPGSRLDAKNNNQHARETGPGNGVKSAAPAAAEADRYADREVLMAGGSSTAQRESEKDTTPGVDRFGQKIKNPSGDGTRHKGKRLEGPPEGTLTVLGWGWGGEFRLGTGRDGFEIWPRALHPYLKVVQRATRGSNNKIRPELVE